MERIPYTDHGGSGRKIVFLHGNGFPPDCYAQFLGILAGHYHVISMHSRTMWQKDVPTDLLSWKVFAHDITTFLQQNELSDAILLGHSFGGLSALRTLQDNPNLRNPLVMVDPVMVSPRRFLQIWWAILRGESTKSRRLQAGALRRKRHFTSPEQAFNAYQGKPVFAKFTDEQLRAFIAGLLVKDGDGYHLRIAPEWEAKIYETAIYKDLDIFLKIPFFPRKALVVWGTESDTLRPDAIAFLRSINRNFIVKEIAGASHLVPFERPEETAKLILQHLSEL